MLGICPANRGSFGVTRMLQKPASGNYHAKIMRKIRRSTDGFIWLLIIVVITACYSPPRAPALGGLYNNLAQSEAPYRNPVILIPGILGSKLVERSSGVIVWGTFGFGNYQIKKEI